MAQWDLRAERKGDWVQTFTGRVFWPMDPLPSEIDIEDIAHALSMQCRFGGHAVRFYSVAEHSVLLARHVAPEHRKWALLHDAAEAYLVDVPRPVKPYLGDYRLNEDRLLIAIATRFGLPTELPGRILPEAVSEADHAILADERLQVMAPCIRAWSLLRPPLGIKMEFWPPAVAERAFLEEWARVQ